VSSRTIKPSMCSRGPFAPSEPLWSGRRGALAICAAALVFALAFALSSATASAAQTRSYTGVSFGPDGVGGSTSFESLQSVAVDSTSGDVFAYDVGAGAIYKFDSDGAPVNFAATGSNEITGVGGSGSAEVQIAVAPPGAPGGTGGDIYVASAGTAVQVYSEAGSRLGEIALRYEVCGVSTDPAGDVFVGIYPHTIAKIVPTTNPPSSTVSEEGSAEVGLCNVGADGVGNVYAANYAGSGLFRLEGLASTPTTLDPSASTLGIDPITDHLFGDRRDEFVEYDASGNLVSVSGAGRLIAGQSRGIAPAPGAEKVYVGSGDSTKIDVFGALESIVEVTPEPPSEIGGEEVTLNGMVNDGGQTVTECFFEYGLTESYTSTAPCVGATPADETPHRVSAAVTDLEAASEYHVRLVVVSASSGSHPSPDLTFRTAGATIQNERATGNSFTGATIATSINPNGFPTTFHVEYLTEPEFLEQGGFAGPATTSTAETGVGSDEALHELDSEIAGLTEGETYRFRIVATSHSTSPVIVTGPGSSFVTRSAGQPNAEVCPNETSRSESGSQALPDCRAYELVTPNFKNGGSFTPSGTLVTDGPRVATLSFGNGFGGTESVGILSTPYEFTRSASGWATIPVAPPGSIFVGGNPISNPLYALGAGGVGLFGLRTVGQPYDAETLYRRSDGVFEQIGPVAPPSSWVLGPAGGPGDVSAPYFPGSGLATSDGSHYVYSLFSPEIGLHSYLWPFDQTAEGHLPSSYEYVGTNDAEPVLVGVRGGQGSHELISGCGTSIGSLSAFGGDTYNALSAGGRTVYFTPSPGFFCTSSIPSPGEAELYARVDGERADAHTVSISEPSEEDCSRCDTDPAARREGVFQGASEDGSKAFFLTEQELLPGNPGQNLYLYDFDGPAGAKVRSVSHMAAGSPAGVLGVVRVSADGSHVYFVATSALSGLPNSTGASAVSGADNMYVYETDTGVTKFVATLSALDEGTWARTDVNREAEATPDGRFLLFTSAGDLTPGDTTTARQLFRYDSQTGELTRISIGQDGFNDNGNTDSDPVTMSPSVDSYAGGQAGPPQKWISDDGSFVVFESSAGLTPKALDHVQITAKGALAMNVYEFHAGQVKLISDGKDRSISGSEPVRSTTALIGIDGDGRDILFTTGSPLIPSDTDSGQDIYDARLQGGVPVEGSRAACSAEACQGPPSTVAGSPESASAQFYGPADTPAKKPAHKKTKHKHAKKKRRKYGGKKRGHSKGPGAVAGKGKHR
jgi:hypothetical protein